MVVKTSHERFGDYAGENQIMPIDSFAEHLARVRQRFVSSLESKIEDTYSDLPKLSGEGRGVTDALGETYRRIHGIVGVAPTLGFAATGQAAASPATETLFIFSPAKNPICWLSGEKNGSVASTVPARSVGLD